MSIFMEKITLTQAEYDATKNTLPADTLVYISDNPNSPLAIGDLEITTGGSGPTTLDQTFVTTTDESATLPNSTNLGGLLTTGQKGVVINSVTSGTSTLTSSVLPASSVLTTNGSSDITGTTLTATKFLTTNASSALTMVTIPASSLLQTDGSSNITGATLTANKLLTTNGSSVLTQVAIPASSVLTTNSSNAITSTALTATKFLTTNGSSALTLVAIPPSSLLQTDGSSNISGATLTANTMLSVNGSGALTSSNTIGTNNGNLTFNVGTGTATINAATLNLNDASTLGTYTITTGLVNLNAALQTTGPLTVTGTTGGVSFNCPGYGISMIASGVPGFSLTTDTNSSGFIMSDSACILLSNANIQLTGGADIQLSTLSGQIKLESGTNDINIPNLAVASGTNLVWNSGGAVTLATSSARFKENIQDITFDTSKLYELAPKSFVYTEAKQDSWGYIAEEVNEVLPELVNYETLEDGSKVPFSLAYDKLSIILLEEIKKLNARIRALEEK